MGRTELVLQEISLALFKLVSGLSLKGLGFAYRCVGKARKPR